MPGFLKFLARYIPVVILAVGASSFAYVLTVSQPWFSNFDALALLDKYSQDEIDHFALFAFQGHDRLAKWEEDILVNIDIQASQDQNIYKATSDCINELNNLMQEVEIRVSGDHSNVQITKVDSIEYMTKGTTYNRINLFRIPFPSFHESEILLMTENKLTGTMSDEDVYALICHEFSHLLGFKHNKELLKESNWTYKSWFNGSTKTWNDTLCDMVQDFQNFPDLDKSAIRIMYDREVGIQPGMTKEKKFHKIDEARKRKTL